jgi:hypothetical protein
LNQHSEITATTAADGNVSFRNGKFLERRQAKRYEGEGTHSGSAAPACRATQSGIVGLGIYVRVVVVPPFIRR